jgi:MSHA biogenesis protein MshK
MADLMMAPRLARTVLAALAAVAALGAASAQEGAPDPTRPPAALAAPVAQPGQSGTVSTAPQLQSILISQRAGGRRIAVISGKTVRQGQRVGAAVVESIQPAEVVLRTGNKRQVLKLFRPAARGAAT